MSTPCIQKAKTAFAEETGRISALVERNLMTGAPSYPLKRIPEKTYDTSLGHSPRRVRVQTVPPARTEYQPLLATGNEAKNFESPLDGSTISSNADKTGRNALPGDTIRFGYEEFGRCLRGTALETEPMDIMDIIEKKAFASVIQKLREDMPRYAKEHFANELLRRVIQFSTRKFSVAAGFPMSVGTSGFPCVPTGGPSIGHLRLIENLIRHEGWDEGSQTPVINGRPALQVYMGRDAIEFAIIQRKREFGLKLESTKTVDDGTFGTTEVSEGIQFIENPMPPRGYVVQTAANAWEFREINPWTVEAGTEGLIKKINADYHASFVTVNGQSFPVIELGFIIHPKAMDREAMGAMPKVDGKTFGKMFNFEVNLIDDWAMTSDPRCNKDKRLIAYRMTHAYAPFPYNPELMTAFAYIAPTPQYVIVNPNGERVTAADEPTTVEAFRKPKVDECNTCADNEPVVRNPVDPTCTDIIPTNGVGLIRFNRVAYDVSEDGGTVTLVAERVGGSSGAATVDWTSANGTASVGTEFGVAEDRSNLTGTLTWADGVFGKKSFTIPIIATAGDDDGKQFTVTLSNATGASLSNSIKVATVTILDSDNA